MRRFIPALALIPALACGNSSYSDIQGPTQGGVPGDDGNTVEVCGVPGELKQAGFSFVDCAQAPRIDGQPFGDAIAAGAHVKIYLDSPNASLWNVTSSDPSVVKFELSHTPGSRTATVTATGVRPGTAKLVLHALKNGVGNVLLLDQADVTVAAVTETALGGGLTAPSVAVIDGAHFTVCPRHEGAGHWLVAENLLQASATDGAHISSGEVDDCLPETLFGGSRISATTEVPFLVDLASGSSGTVRFAEPGFDRTFDLKSITLADVTDVTFDPPTLALTTRPSLQQVNITIKAGELPVAGTTCEMTAQGLTMMGPSGRSATDHAVYTVIVDTKVRGPRSITCSLDHGRIVKSVSVTAE